MSTAHDVMELLDTGLKAEDLDALDFEQLARFASLTHHWLQLAQQQLYARARPKTVGQHEEERE